MITRGTRIGHFLVTAAAAPGRHTSMLQARDVAGRFVALKLATSDIGAQLVRHEADVLSELVEFDGAAALVDVGDAGGSTYAATAWIPGLPVRAAIRELRERASHAEVLALCSRIAHAYADLHGHGVLHGQVHPRHIVVGRHGEVALLDFSVAASARVAPPPARLAARFNSLSAPEHAAALVADDAPVLTTEAEQYSLAALLYLLVAGRMYARLRLEREHLTHDIMSVPPRPLGAHVLDAPRLEAVLGSALAKNPETRYESTAAFAAALASAAAGAATRKTPRAYRRSALARMLATFRSDAASAEAMRSLTPPTCSVNFGAAGVAFALTRLGKTTQDATAFEHADRWLSFAEERASDPDAFDDGDELTPETIGLVSPFHTRSGLPAARGFLSAATGDHDRYDSALDHFRAATAERCENLDATLGRSAVLLVAALLLAEATHESGAVQRLARYGDELQSAIWLDAPRESPMYYGIAHGLAGLAYASLAWSRARGPEPPRGVADVLDRLACAAEPYGRGLRWPLSPPGGAVEDQFWLGWCHGNAGYVFLWNLAAQTYGEASFAALAERTACLLDVHLGITSLCCGTAGQAYALLDQYGTTGEREWRSLAARVAERAAADASLADDATSPLSLYKGHVGLVLLAPELERPARAAMPLFEFEAAPGHGQT